MDTATLPEIIIPDIKMSPEDMLNAPTTIGLSKDIADPDRIIDELISRFRADGNDAIWLDKVKGLEHQDKVQWLLSLPDPDRNIGCMGYLVIIVTYLTIMVAIGTGLNGETIYEQRKVEKKVEKCVPKQP